MKMVERRRKIKGNISLMDYRDLVKFKKSILEGITEVEARLHRIILSGDYLYRDLDEKLGKLVPDKQFKRKKRMPLYRRRARRTFEGMPLTIFYNPTSGYGRQCRIEFNFLSPESLMMLYKQLPKLKITSVEYTVDIFCRNHRLVANLFYLLLHYMYFEYQTKKMEPFGDPFDVYEDKREENAGYHIGENAKIYERGPDNTRGKRTDEEGYVKVFWPHRKVDRVRVEFTFDRRHPGRGGFDELKDLIVHPEFENKIYNLFQFKVFSKSNELPRETEEYWYKDGSGEKGDTQIFQEVYINAPNSGIRNPRQYLEDAEGFDHLKKKLKSAMRKFDRKWVKRRKGLFKKQLGVSN